MKNYKNINISIKDLRGRLIKNKIERNTSFIEMELDVATGIYLLIIEINNKKRVIKLIKN